MALGAEAHRILKVIVLSVVLLWIAWQQHQVSLLHDEIASINGRVVSFSAQTLGHRQLLEFDLNADSPPPLKGLPPKKIVGDSFYGGKGDRPHLGGFTYKIDMDGISTNVWYFMLGSIGVRSIVDVGCGMGVSSSFFLSQGVDVLCVEGSSDAVKRSLMPKERIIEHDFSLGPWWPRDTYDAIWSVEFVEHVGRQYMANYLPIFKKAAIVFVTSSGNGGWHHVEVHEKWWWRGRMIAEGFIFANDLTKFVRNAANVAIHKNETSGHIRHGMDVFINPRVAGLPQHKHLFAGKGCYHESVDNQNGGMACPPPDNLPPEFETLLDCTRMRTGQDKSLRYMDIPWNCRKNPRYKQ